MPDPLTQPGRKAVASPKTGQPTSKGVAQIPNKPSAGHPRPRGRAWLIGFGIIAILTGLTLLGYVGWEMIGTNIVSKHKQERAVEELQQRWRDDPTGHTTAVMPGDAEALIRIPRFGPEYVMPIFHGVNDGILAEGFGHFADSAAAGNRGNFALAAHRVTHGEPLRNMPDLRPGDTFEIETKRMIYTYQLDTDPNDLIVDLDQTWVLDPHPTNPQPGGVEPPSDEHRLITLTTCSELFHTDDRMIAFGHLIDVHDKTDAYPG